jgi:hypothetical protein
MTTTTVTPTAHVVTKGGRVVVIFWGEGAGEEAAAWVRRGYHVAPIDSSVII